MKKIIFCAALLALCFIGFAASPLQPGTLTCEHDQNPLGIETSRPRFSWTMISNKRDQRQSAYELAVGDDPKEVALGKGKRWTSGKVNTAQSLLVTYEGAPLSSFKRYYWSVRVYNQDGEASSWSKPSWFETAMLNPGEWKANWISDGSKNPAKEEDYYKDDRMPLFRKVFSADRKISSARLYISGMGYYEAYLNGKKVSENVLDPGFTTYRKEALYVTHDITRC